MSKVVENPIVGIVAGAGLAAVGAMTGQPALIGMGVSMGLGSASNMLAPSPKMPSRSAPRQAAQTSPLRGRTLNIRESDSPHRLIYGTARVGGNLMFAHVTGNDKEYLHLVYVLAGHPVRRTAMAE